MRLGPQTTISDEGMFAIGCCFKCNRQGVSVRDIDNCDVSFTPSYALNMTIIIFVIPQTLKSVGIMTGTSILPRVPYVISAWGTQRR